VQGYRAQGRWPSTAAHFGLLAACLLDDAVARGHGDARHPNGLAFALHDLCHLEKFVAPEHHAGQLGFFRLVQRALDTPALPALDREPDDAWRADRDYVLADMNGSPSSCSPR
jgi:hypothetical protein